MENRDPELLWFYDSIIYNIQFSTKYVEAYKETVKCDPYLGKKKQSMETASQRPQILDLADQDFKEAICMFKELNGTI